MQTTAARPLEAETFRADPDVIAAKQTLLAALARRQAGITGVRPPDPERKQSYAETLDAFAQARGGKLWFPFLGSGIGRGPLVELADGSVKYDFISGIGVHHLGHSHPRLVEAGLNAALGDTIMQGNLQQNVESYSFCRKLLAAANAQGARFDHSFLTATGVMAGENALKIAMQKKQPASRVLAFCGCFAGRTMAFSQITDKPGFRQGLPHMLHVDYVPFFDSSQPEESMRRSLGTLKRHLARYPGQHAAMIMELVQGEGGFYTATAEFHRAIMETLREHNVAVLVDEVQTFARTHQLFAFQHYGLDDLVDIVWLGKASQVCATLFREDYKPKPGLLSQTFTGSSSAIAGGEAVLDEFLEGDYFGPEGKIARMHEQFRGRLEAISRAHPDRLTGPYGIGAMVACTPLGGDAKKVGPFIQALFHNGVMGFVAGANPARARFLVPAAAVEPADIDAVAAIFEKTLLEQ